MMTRTGPNQSVNVPHTGLLPIPTSAATESKSVAKSVENPRTLWRYTTKSEYVRPLPVHPTNVPV